jgi:signal transduction histidine kinase/AmiR/NasT family two-component response regulator
MRWRFSLTYPILALISFAAIGVALPLYFISVASLRKSIDTLELSKAKEVHHVVESAINSEVGRLVLLAGTMGKHHDLADALKRLNDTNDTAAFIRSVEPIAAGLDVGFVQIADSAGRVVYFRNTTIDPNLGVPGLAETSKGLLKVSTSRQADGFAIRASAPVWGAHNEILGAIIVGFVINDAFAERIASITETDIAVGSADGVIASSQRAHTCEQHCSSDNAAIEQAILQSIKDAKGSYKTLCEHDRILYYKQLPIVDEVFSLMVVMDTSQSGKLFTRTRYVIALTAAVAFAIAWLFGIMFTGTLVKPMQLLRDQSCQTIKSITGQTVNPHSGNELDALVCSFETMRDSLISYISGLQEAETKLREHKEHLEELVAERTENLKEINEQLQTEIAERRRMEQELKNSNRGLNNSNQQLQEFLYVASHDMREPLRKISAFAGLLTGSLAGRLTSDEQENFDFMIEGTARMREIVESLLAYSKLISRRSEPEQIDLNKVVAGLRSYELAAELERLRASLRIPKRLPAVKGDPAQVTQLFENIIRNALKYHKQGIAPQVTIRAQGTHDGMVRIEVQDNGIGIRPEHQNSIFAMFRRFHPEQEYEGLGAGLAICRRIVEQHGGQIGVDSTYGQGSTFWFTLPAAQAVAEEQTHQTQEDAGDWQNDGASQSGAVVLVVEDDIADQKLIANAMAKADVPCEVQMAASAEEALERLRQGSNGHSDYRRPNIILLDLNMPGMGGREFLRQTRTDEELRHIPVVVLTTSTSKADVELCYKLRASGYIQKSASSEEFQKVLQKFARYWFVTSKLASQ